MSYDLAVFDPVAAPRERSAFSVWFRAQTQWKEGHKYDDPKVSTPALREWFLSMIVEFPALNGPYARRGLPDESAITDYTVGSVLIYAGFRWSNTQKVYKAVLRLAEEKGVGFFDVSGGELVWWPGADGKLVAAFAI